MLGHSYTDYGSMIKCNQHLQARNWLRIIGDRANLQAFLQAIVNAALTVLSITHS